MDFYWRRRTIRTSNSPRLSIKQNAFAGHAPPEKASEFSGAPSIAPEVGWKLCLPRFHASPPSDEPRWARDRLSLHFTYPGGTPPVKLKLCLSGAGHPGTGGPPGRRSRSVPAPSAHGILVARGMQGQYIKGVCCDRDRRQVDTVWAMPSDVYGGGTIEFRMSDLRISVDEPPPAGMFPGALEGETRGLTASIHRPDGATTSLSVWKKNEGRRGCPRHPCDASGLLSLPVTCPCPQRRRKIEIQDSPPIHSLRIHQVLPNELLYRVNHLVLEP